MPKGIKSTDQILSLALPSNRLCPPMEAFRASPNVQPPTSTQQSLSGILQNRLCIPTVGRFRDEEQNCFKVFSRANFNFFATIEFTSALMDDQNKTRINLEVTC